MARKWTINIPGNAFMPDNDEQMVSGDDPATPVQYNNRVVWAMDDTQPEAIISPEMALPAEHDGGTPTAVVHFFSETAASNGFRLEVRVEAVTPNSDTLDHEATHSWGSANAATHTLAGTAGDARSESISLSNFDSGVAGDKVRLGVRRDSTHSGDSASDDCFVEFVEFYST